MSASHGYSLRGLIASLLVVAVFLGGCTDGFTDLNRPDNQLTEDEVNVNLLGQSFAQSQYRGMYGLHWQFQISTSLFADLYAQYFATTAANFDSDQYVEVGRWASLAWTSFYGDAAPQLDLVLNKTEEEGLTVEHAVAEIWKVQLYHRISDYWGPIILSEFGEGGSSVGYDSQKEAYMNFFSTLDESIEVLENNQGANAFGSNDIVYGGDVNKWLRFANSLKLRLAMRVRYVPSSDLDIDPQTKAEEAIQSGVIEGNGGNAMVKTTADNRNPYSTITDWGEFRMSSAMESALEGYDDPRTGVYFSEAVNGDEDGDGSPYEGFRNGLPRSSKPSLSDGTNLNDTYSDMGTRFLNSNRGGVNPDIPVMRAAEVYFLRAEGALMGWNMDGTTEDLYDTGIEMSLSEERIGASASEIDEYINSGNTPTDPQDRWDTRALSDVPVDFDTGASTERQLEQIITQKWLALYPDAREAWSEHRRTGYPKLPAIVESQNQDVGPDEIMRRMTFVSAEYTQNTEATENAVGLLDSDKGDQNDARLWWDKKPLSEFPER